MKLPQPMATHTAPGQAFIAAPDPYDFFFVFFFFSKSRCTELALGRCQDAGVHACRDAAAFPQLRSGR